MTNTSLALALFLPPEDSTYLSQSRFTSTFDDEDPDYMDYAPPLFTADASVLNSHLTSKPSISIIQYS